MPIFPDSRWYSSSGTSLSASIAGRIDVSRNGGRRLELAVVAVRAEHVEEALGERRDLGADPREHLVAVGRDRDRPLDHLARLAQRTRRCVDRERGLVAPQVTDHRRQHERERGVDRGHGQHRRGRSEPLVALGRDDDRRGLVGAVDRDLLADVVGRAADEPGRADEDQRLTGEVDVLLVLGDVAGDRLVAELAELDPHLLGGDDVRAVADDRPVPLRRGEPLRGLRRWPAGWRAPRASPPAARAARRAPRGARADPTPAASVIAQASSVPAATCA